MKVKDASFLTKLRWSSPWLTRYPLWAMNARFRRIADSNGLHHLIFVVANHFEPGWNEQHIPLGWAAQRSRLEHWCKQARAIGRAVRDSDGMPFRHTYFYPAEQYHPSLLDDLANLQAEGFGEVEVHLHHGMDRPDTEQNLKRTLEDFRDTLSERHRCLSRLDGISTPMYAFVHGNWALANSWNGSRCGVDSEMEILAKTGCYADFTLPSAPYPTQVPKINAIYQCGHPLHERSPHRSGTDLCVHGGRVLPILFTGPLVFRWRQGRYRLPVPRFEDGVLCAKRPLNLNRLRCWTRARIGIRGRPEWIFIKLSCHGFVDVDQPATIGEPMRRFLECILELGDRSGKFKVHFATAREAFNIAMAAVAGQTGEPGAYRNHGLVEIMQAKRRAAPGV